MKKKSNGSFWKRAIVIVAIVFGISVVTGIVGTVATYPTNAHRDNARTLAQLDNQFFSGQASVEVLDSEQYKDLSENQYGSYSGIAGTVVAVLQFALMVYLIGVLYRYLRRRRVSKHTVWVTTLLYSIGSFITIAPLLAFDSWYYGYQLSTTVLAFALTGASIFGVLITYFIAWIYQWHYNRNHSFIVED